MLSKKNRVPLFFLIITIIYMIVVGIYILGVVRAGQKIVPILPWTVTTQVIILFIGVPILITIQVAALRLVTILNFKFSTKFQKNYEYYYIDIIDKEYKSRRMVSRALLPVSMALAVSLLINSISIFLGFFGTDSITSIIFLTLLLTPITSFLLLAIWVMKDTGVVKIRKKLDKRIPPELSYFGKVQFQSYRGFAGISTPILYIITIVSSFQIRLNFESLIILIFPIVLIGLYMPLLVLYEKRLPKVGAKIIKKFEFKHLNMNDICRNIFGDYTTTTLPRPIIKED